MTNYGYFILSDISGFAAYLKGVELEHAKDILGVLLTYVAEQINSMFIFEKFEGDAVFGYAPKEKITHGADALELIESTYAGFKDRLVSISRHVTCNCSACRNVINLDLKFMLHYGEYMPQHVGEYHELLGGAPNFVRRREWKEVVANSVGWRGYVLFSEVSLEQLNILPENLEGTEFLSAEIKLYGRELNSSN